MTRRTAVAKVAVLNEKGEILVLRRSASHKTKAHWTDIPGGLVDPGESEHTAAVREVQEETGITFSPFECMLFYTDTQYYPDEGNSVAKLLYFVKLDHTPAVAISWEHEEYTWCTLEELLAREDFQTFYRAGIEYAIEHDIFNS